MKKILLSSIVLTAFSVSIVIFQISCQKSVSAQTSQQILNKVLLLKHIEIQTGSTSDSSGHNIPLFRTSAEFYTVQYDGTNFTKININMPAGVYPINKGILSPDGKRIVFEASNENGQYSVYSYSLEDAKLTRLADGDYSVQSAL